MKPLHKRSEVVFDLAEIYAWIGERNLEAADRFLDAANETFEQIRRHPRIGWQRRWKNRALAGLRSWRVNGFDNYLVFYREELHTIEIYGVLNAARHLGRALRKR